MERRPADPEHPAGLKGGWQGRSAGEALTGAAVCSEEAGSAAAQPGLHAHLALPAGVLPLAHGCGGRKGTQHSQHPKLGSHPIYHRDSIPRESSIPLPAASLRLSCGSAGQDPLEQSFRTQRMSVGTPLWDPSPSITHRPCTPSRPASSRDSTRGRSGTCGTDRGCHPGLGDQGDIMASAKEKRSLPQC